AQTLDRPLVLKRDNVFAVRAKTALNFERLRRPARCHAEGDGCESLDDVFHQRWACASQGLDATPDDHGPERLTDLHAHGTISMRDDAIERGPVDGPALDIEPAGARAKGFDGRFDLQVTERAEVDAPNTAGSPGGDLGLGDPPVHYAPVIERHV